MGLDYNYHRHDAVGSQIYIMNIQNVFLELSLTQNIYVHNN